MADAIHGSRVDGLQLILQHRRARGFKQMVLAA